MTKHVQSREDIRQFFNRFAAHNVEHHGAAGRLLAYRLQIFDQFSKFSPLDTVLDVGCGNGKHLFALDGRIGQAIGIDFSTNMIARACSAVSPRLASAYSFRVDNAEQLSTIPDQSVDVVICSGALEHMLDKESVIHAIYRVLKRGGRFVCLTLNNEFVWYSRWAPALGLPTYHLSTDRRLDTAEADRLLRRAPFSAHGIQYWTFIPRGDMPAYCAIGCTLLDRIGRWGGARWLRSGMVLYAER